MKKFSQAMNSYVLIRIQCLFLPKILTFITSQDVKYSTPQE